MDDFCGTKFWDWNLTWFTDSPNLTPCFEETILVWIPCGYSFLFFFFGCYKCRKSKYRDIPWGLLNITKTMGIFTLFFLSFCDILYAYLLHPKNLTMYAVDYSSAIIKHLTFALLTILIILFHKYGIRTSFITFSIWFLFVVCSIPHYISQIIMARHNKDDIRLYPYISNVIYFPVLLSMFFLELFVDARPISSLYPPLKHLPATTNVSFANNFILLWFDMFAFRNYRSELKLENLPGPHYHMRLEYLVPRFTKKWNAKLTAIKQKYEIRKSFQYSQMMSREYVSVVSVLWNCFSYTYILMSLYKLFADSMMFANTQILRVLIAFIENDEPIWHGYLYALALTLCSFSQTFLINIYLASMTRIGLNMRTVLTAVLFRKVLRISNKAKKMFTSGDIANLMSVDAQRFVDLLLYSNLSVAIPLTVLTSLFFLWQMIGFSALAGLAFMLLIIPLNLWGGNKMRKLQVLQMKLKDERLKITSEVLSGIKVLKMYAWEPCFSKKISQIRDQEIKILKKIAYIDTAVSFIWFMTPFLVSLVTFVVFTLADENNVLTTEIAFVSLSLFNTMKMPISLIPKFVNSVTQTAVAAKRISKFLNAEELKDDVVSHRNIAGSAVQVENGTFCWDEDDTLAILKNINLTVTRRSLIAIVGPVGSGKSSLLSAILGEMCKLDGRVNTRGSTAYVPQQAWIQNATLRENILFMSAYNQSVYDKVVESCALLPDFNVLPAGDATEIGEKGVNLSGGQKQRISLARAVYNNADIYFLDDPLSAVDAHVGKHIFENVIGPHGLLRKKTRLLVINSITYLPEMDFIVILKEGAIVECGTHEQLISKKGEFAQFLANYTSDGETKDENTEAIIDRPTTSLTRQRTISQELTLSNCELSTLPNEMDHQQFSIEPIMGENLIEIEKMQNGQIKLQTYWYYMKAGGVLLWLGTIIFNILFQILSVLANLWLTFWSTDPDIGDNPASDPSKKYFYLNGYCLYGIGIAAAAVAASLAINSATVSASAFVHQCLLVKVFRWPAYLFDTTPLGRIMNRFSYDVDVVDNAFPYSLKQIAVVGGSVLSTLCLIVYSSPVFVVVLIPMFFLYIFLEHVNVRIVTKLKRLESIHRSPVYSHFTETITGASVIRAYKMEENFIKESEDRIFKSQVCYYPTIQGTQWINLRLDSFGNIIILIASLLAVLYRGVQNVGILSLSVTYALQITRSLSWVVRTATDIEANAVSIECIKTVEKTPEEKLQSAEYKTVPPLWPDKGVVVFDQYKTRYREGLDFVLEGLNLRIESGEKIGIIGRTGAGKSSLTLSLFRIIEAAEGRIIIDDVNISEIELQTLRSRITIIPQDPVLFSGTVRTNLDPFFEYTDGQLWRTLELAHLKNFISSLSEGLNYNIMENGSNLSIGQRQLICLARALLRKTKILVLDEATAAIDLETDELIQATIRKEFKECTVLTIAHKLNTVMDSDRIIVLDQGLVKEFDTPAILLDMKTSIFYSMAKESGLVS